MDMTNVLPLRDLEFHGLLMITAKVLSKLDNLSDAGVGLDNKDMIAMKRKIDAILEFLAQEDKDLVVDDYYSHISKLTKDEQLAWPQDLSQEKITPPAPSKGVTE